MLQEKLKLQDPELFDYTGQSGVIHIDGVSDEKEFEDVQVSTLFSLAFFFTLALELHEYSKIHT